jgi:hypothetical protein
MRALDRVGDQCLHFGGECGAGRLELVGGQRLAPRVELGQEQLDQQTGNRGIAIEGFLHVGLREGGAGLQQILAVATQHRDLAPAELGAQHQTVEAVVFGMAAPYPPAATADARLRRPRPDSHRPHSLPAVTWRSGWPAPHLHDHRADASAHHAGRHASCARCGRRPAPARPGRRWADRRSSGAPRWSAGPVPLRPSAPKNRSARHAMPYPARPRSAHVPWC